jgi:hypothetical protein
MRFLKQAFTDHPKSVGESYGAHLLHALGFAGGCALAAGACLVHAVFPFLCVKTGSRQITALHDRMVTNRDRRTAAPIAAPIGPSNAEGSDPAGYAAR